MKSYLLEPKHDSAKSFYRKARVEFLPDGDEILISYETPVALWVKFDNTLVLQHTDKFSATTLRHVKEFLKQSGFKAENKKQILADYKEL